MAVWITVESLVVLGKLLSLVGEGEGDLPKTSFMMEGKVALQRVPVGTFTLNLQVQVINSFKGVLQGGKVLSLEFQTFKIVTEPNPLGREVQGVQTRVGVEGVWSDRLVI